MKRRLCQEKKIFKMPKYLYECDTCEEKFLAYHLMSEILDVCKKCDAKGGLKKLPLFPVNLSKNKKTKKAGDVVKRHIEDAKKDLREEQKELSTKEYSE